MALTADEAAKKVETLWAELSSRQSDVQQFEDYFDGNQPLCYASEEFRDFHRDRFAGWSDNWCGVVGSAAPELTEFASIRLGDDADDMSADERELLRDWNRLEGPALSAQGFLSGAVTKRSFALVWGKPGTDDEPTLTWEHASQAVVGYDPETRKRVAGLKAWRDGDLEFATLYTDDEVWKFQREPATKSALVLPSYMGLDGGWTLREGTSPNPVPNPLGVVPLVEFPNRPQLRHGPISDIQGTVAAQDAINLLWAYLFGAADWASMPGRVVMGQEPPKVPILDDNGQKIGERAVDSKELTRGRMLWLTGQNTTIGQFDSAKLDIFTNVVDVLVKHVAAQSKVPINYFGALSNVNGETLTGLRTPLNMKVRDGHKHLTGPQRELFRLLALARGNTAVAEACRTAVIGWKNPETSSDAQTSDAALKDSQIGWSSAGILERRYGMTQPEIDRELQRREAEGESDPVIGAARALTGGVQESLPPGMMDLTATGGAGSAAAGGR